MAGEAMGYSRRSSERSSCHGPFDPSRSPFHLHHRRRRRDDRRLRAPRVGELPRSGAAGVVRPGEDAAGQDAQPIAWDRRARPVHHETERRRPGARRQDRRPPGVRRPLVPQRRPHDVRRLEGQGQPRHLHSHGRRHEAQATHDHGDELQPELVEERPADRVDAARRHGRGSAALGRNAARDRREPDADERRRHRQALDLHRTRAGAGMESDRGPDRVQHLRR